MEFRPLDVNDRQALSSFIFDSYDDYPNAMWFDAKPTEAALANVFHSKIMGIDAKMIIDYVMVDYGVIMGECEIVRIQQDEGIIGIILRKDAQGQGFAKNLLNISMNQAQKIGIKKFKAEVEETNTDGLNFFEVNGFSKKGTKVVNKIGIYQNMVIMEKI